MPLHPYDLRTERATNPLGIDDPTPVLGWKLASVGRSERQTGYRIVVREQPRGRDALVGPDDDAGAARTVWDSGFVRSADQVDVPYAGGRLRDRTRYVWAVRVRDEHGVESAWSDPATFETGVGTWPAAWITCPAEPRPARMLDVLRHPENVHRIWLPDESVPRDPGVPAAWAGDPAGAGNGVEPREFPIEPAIFRTFVDMSAERPISDAAVLADAADGLVVGARVNGWDVAWDGNRADTTAGAFGPGRNAVEIAVRPAASAHARRPPGLAARIEVWHPDGRSTVTGTGPDWRCRIAAPGDGVPGDGVPGDGVPGDGGVAAEGGASWRPAQSLGPHGAPPYGRAEATYRPSPLLRRAFTLPSEVRGARLYATALGLYEVRINGRRVGDAVLTPGWTDYRHGVAYQTYDVSPLLRPGRNALAVTLADGWYAGHVGWLGRDLYGDVRAFSARLEVEHTDGARSVLPTDETWRAGEGEVRYADLQQGEVVDLRRHPDGWDVPGFDDSSWRPARVLAPDAADTPVAGPVTAQLGPPVRVRRRQEPAHVARMPDGRLLVDFGRNLVGWVRLRARGPAGARVLLAHAETVDHRGEPYTAGLRTARATDEFVLAGRPDRAEAADGEWLEPRFTVHGFRYCAITTGPDVAVDRVTAAVAYADMPRTGNFACSDPRLTTLHRNILASQRGNFLSVPTDCPQRDERLGWTGDAQVFAATAMFGYDTRAFFRAWLADVRRAQHADGGVPHVVPDLITMCDDRPRKAGGAGWADVIAVLPYELYHAYGDRRAVEDCYPAVVAWLDYLEANSTGRIRPDERFGDHLALVDTPRDLVNTAFYAHTAWLAARLAEVLGRDDEARSWRALRQEVRAAFRERYVTGGGTVASGTQAAYALALHFDLFDPEETDRAVANLVEELAARNWHVTTGYLGSPFLLPALTRFGRVDAAYRLLTTETYPSWLYPVVHGDATTIWERWDSWNDAHGFADPGMTSFNHYAYGAVGAWMYRTIAGLAPGAPGYRHVVVRPVPGRGVRHARAALETPYGRVAVSWRWADSFELELRTPPNTTAEVWLPGAAEAERVGPGRHRFERRTRAPARGSDARGVADPGG